MARRRSGGMGEEKASPDLTPMMDLTFNIVSFFVMIMAISKDEGAQKVNLPFAASAPIVTDEEIPKSFNINVDSRSYLLGWGVETNLKSDGGLRQLKKFLNIEANAEKSRDSKGEWKSKGLQSTVIIRVDKEVEYSIFRKIMDACREVGFTKYHLKAAEDDDNAAPRR